MMVGRLGHETGWLSGKTLVEVLLDPRTDIGLLRAIKECCKRLSSGSGVQGGDRCRHDLCTMPRLASALVYHDKRITQHSYETLDEAFKLLIDKPWMDPELAGLFSQARGLCRGKEDRR